MAAEQGSKDGADAAGSKGQEQAEKWIEVSWEQSGAGGDPVEELFAAFKARELAHGEPSVEFRLAVLLHGAGRWQEAAQAFGACADSSEELGEAVYLDAGRLGRSACLLAAGDAKGAMVDLDKVGPTAQLWLGELFDVEKIATAAAVFLR